MRAAAAMIPILSIALALPLFAADPALLQLGVEASIDPAGDGTYVCVVKVSDLDSSEVLAAPTLRFRSGEEASVAIGPIGGADLLKIQVVADENEGSARFVLSVVHEGTEKTLQRLNFKLK